MLPRHHRRRLSMLGEPQRQKPALLVRLIAAAVVLFVLWYIVSRILSFFDGSIGKKTATLLTIRSGDSVQVSLQGGDWQRGESNLKLYAGDSVAVRGSSDAYLSFFDGTKVRLEQGSEVSINDSNRLIGSTSSIGLTLKTGRIWVASATPAAFTGSIVREITMTNAIATVPADAQVLLSSTLVNVVRASNLGVRLTFTIPKAKVSDIYVGEGQYFSLSEDTVLAITNGKDPYTFRDPVTQQLLKDDFLTSSYAFFTSAAAETDVSGTTSSTGATSDGDLTLLTPENRAKITTKTVKVSGMVSDRVAALRVNGENVIINRDRTFSVDVSLSKDKTTSLSIEAEDQQGITLASVDRVVDNLVDVRVEPVRFKSPVGSGETLRTGLQEIEITGEAPAGTKSVVVNDYPLQLFKPGSKTWSYLASTKLGNLQKGKNVFAVYATDADDNRSPARSITIEYVEGGAENTGSTASDQSAASSLPPLKQNPPISPGSLAVSAPVAGTAAETSEKEVVLEGTTSADTNSISINGYTLALYKAGKTTWNYIASTELQTMKRGKNVYRIVSRNASGEILDVLEYTVTYNP